MVTSIVDTFFETFLTNTTIDIQIPFEIDWSKVDKICFNVEESTDYMCAKENDLKFHQPLEDVHSIGQLNFYIQTFIDDVKNDIKIRIYDELLGLCYTQLICSVERYRHLYF